MDNRTKILNLLGIATKSGHVATGEYMTENAIKDFSACLVILSEEASGNTKKHFTDMCTYREIPMRVLGTKEELGKHTGKEIRAVLAITDEGLANAMMKLF